MRTARRPWDELAWSRATRGYARVRAAIPFILHAVNVQRSPGISAHG